MPFARAFQIPLNKKATSGITSSAEGNLRNVGGNFGSLGVMRALAAAVIVTVVVPGAVKGPGGTEHVTPYRLLDTEQLSVTLPVKFATVARSIVDVAEAPGWIVSVVGLAVI